MRLQPQTQTQNYKTMRVLSWDVGLRTLSYCLIEADVTSEDKRFNIVEWDSIDVHVDGVNDGVNDGANDTVSTKKGSGVGRAAKRVKTAAVSIEEGARLIMDALHRRHDMLTDNVDAVVIEQQPAGGHNQHSNVRMKVMSHAIHCYFYSRNISATPPRHTPITFVPASSKFEEKTKEPKTKRRSVDAESQVKSQTESPTESAVENLVESPVESPTESAVESPTESAVESPTESAVEIQTESAVKSLTENASSATGPSLHTQYSKNKKYAVEKTGELLRDGLATTDRSRVFFESTSTKKKDDLADSFLLGYYFLSKQRATKTITAINVKSEKKPRKRKSGAVPSETADAAADVTAKAVTVVDDIVNKVDGAQKPEKKQRKRKSGDEPVVDVVNAVNDAQKSDKKPEKKQRKRKTDQPLES